MTSERDPRDPPLSAYLKWSLLMIGISILVALIATPILRWLGFD
jgi:hypothetical protein